MAYLDAISSGGVRYDLGKPIYYHPIIVTTDALFRFQCVILDNNPNAYTRTTFKAKVHELCDLGAFINVNGEYQDSDEGKMVHLDLITKLSGSYKLIGSYYTQMNITYDLDTIFDGADQFTDGVNKIN